MKKAIRPGFGTDGLLLWRKMKLLRCGDGELCIAGEKDIICLVKINRLLKALIQNVYPASVLHYDTGYGTVEAEEVRIGLFSRVCRQGNALAAKLHGGDRERFQPVGSVLAPAGAGFQGDGFGQQLNLPIKILPRKRHILGKNFFRNRKKPPGGAAFCLQKGLRECSAYKGGFAVRRFHVNGIPDLDNDVRGVAGIRRDRGDLVRDIDGAA